MYSYKISNYIQVACCVCKTIIVYEAVCEAVVVYETVIVYEAVCEAVVVYETVIVYEAVCEAVVVYKTVIVYEAALVYERAVLLYIVFSCLIFSNELIHQCAYFCNY